MDDMTLNAARASAAANIVALQENKPDPENHAMGAFLDLAQADKNCYDSSELILHAKLRLDLGRGAGVAFTDGPAEQIERRSGNTRQQICSPCRVLIYLQ